MAKYINNETTNNVIFYRNNFRIFTWFTMVLLSIAFAILVYIFYSKITQPDPSYFATTSDGYLIEIKPKPQQK